MAKLGSYYGLCPIIDQRSLLGINNDVQLGHVLVTLGKNIAIKYKLSNQKQLTSWRTKDKFTSPVIYYDNEDKYCAVFGQTHIRLWGNDDESLDKHKKFKFNKPIHTLHKSGNLSYIIFKCGAIVSLERALAERKTFVPEDILAAGESIVDTYMINDGSQAIVGLLVQTGGKEDCFEYIYSMLDAANPNNSKRTVTRIKLQKEGATLSGLVMNRTTNQEITLLTLWSDGKLFSHNLTGFNVEESFISTIDSIACEGGASIVALSEDYISIYAADKSQEGALLIIYNIQFKVTQCKQQLKVFTNEAKLYALQDNIFFCVGQNLAVVPYHLDAEQLAALVGSHQSIANDPDVKIVQELVTTKWDNTKSLKKRKRDIDENIKTLSRQGLAEAHIIAEVLPEYIENNDLERIEQCIDYFVDIPEQYRVTLLNYLLALDKDVFPTCETLNENIPEALAPFARCLLIDKLLIPSFNNVQLLPQLRAHLSVSNALLLLRYLCYLLSEEGHAINTKLSVPQVERKLIDWGSILLDAHYSKFRWTVDQKIVETLTYFNELVKAHLCCIDEFQKIAPVVQSIKSGSYQKTKAASNVLYEIDDIQLF